MAEGGHDGAWYCSKSDKRATCPQHGCPKGYCARNNGWLPGMPEPDHYARTPPATQAKAATSLSTELARLAEAATQAIPDGFSVETSALAKIGLFVRHNLPAIIAALKAAETPLPDVAGLVERFIRYAEILEENETRLQGRKATNTWAVGFREAADTITAQARQIAERDAEVKRLREALSAYLNDPYVQRIGGSLNLRARRALEGNHD